MKQFVPLTDDFPVETLQWPEQLVPYRCGVPCEHSLSEPETARDQRTGQGQLDQQSQGTQVKSLSRQH